MPKKTKLNQADAQLQQEVYANIQRQLVDLRLKELRQELSLCATIEGSGAEFDALLRVEGNYTKLSREQLTLPLEKSRFRKEMYQLLIKEGKAQADYFSNDKSMNDAMVSRARTVKIEFWEKKVQELSVDVSSQAATNRDGYSLL